jgi:hypothetical protein
MAFTSVRPHWLKLDKPNWEIKAKPGNDKTGDKRGARGVDREDNSEWFRTFSKAADREIYGPDYVGYYNQVTSDDNAQLEGDDA